MSQLLDRTIWGMCIFRASSHGREGQTCTKHAEMWYYLQTGTNLQATSYSQSIFYCVRLEVCWHFRSTVVYYQFCQMGNEQKPHTCLFPVCSIVLVFVGSKSAMLSIMSNRKCQQKVIQNRTV